MQNQAIFAVLETLAFETLANFIISLNNNTLGLEQIKPKLNNMVALKRADWVVDLRSTKL